MTPPLISEPIWHAFGWAMLHFLWVGGAVCLLFALVERLLLRHASSGARYLHGLLCLGALVVAATTCVWHEWPRPAPETASSGTPRQTLGPLPNSHEPKVEPRPFAPPESVEFSAEIRFAEVAPPAPGPARWVAFLPWIWLAGSAGFASFLTLGLAGTWRLRRGATMLGPHALRAQCDRLRARLRMRARVGLAVSESVRSPLMLGVFRPLIVLPAAAVSGMSPSMVEWVLLHELAHVRRWDNAVIVAQRVLECLLFFHPGVWLASRWVDREREFCCDGFALAHNRERDPTGYAETLARLAGVAHVPMATVSAMANHALVYRIRRILNRQGGVSRRGGAGAVLVLPAIAAISLAMMIGGRSRADPVEESPADAPGETKAGATSENENTPQ